MNDLHAIAAIIKPLSQGLAHLSVMGRTQLLMSLLAHEVCMMPPANRAEAMAGIILKLPTVLRAAEVGMRLALIDNARNGI